MPKSPGMTFCSEVQSYLIEPPCALNIIYKIHFAAKILV